MRNWARVAVGVSALAGALPASAQALTVDNSSDAAPTGTHCTAGPGDCSLRQAIAVAAPGESVHIPASIAPITVSSELLVTKELTVEGAGMHRTVVSGGHEARVFRVNTDGHVVIREMTVRDGWATDTEPNTGGGAIFGERGRLTLEAVNVTSSYFGAGATSGTANQGGGGVHSNGRLTLRRTQVRDNVLNTGVYAADAKGGAGVFNAGPSLLVDRSSVSDNDGSLSGDEAIGGAGLYNAAGATGASIVDSQLSYNQGQVAGSASGGGGLYDAAGDLELVRSAVLNNELKVGGGPAAGGAGVFENGGSLRVVNSSLASNSLYLTAGEGPRVGGEGIYHNADAALTLLNAAVIGNDTFDGSGDGIMNDGSVSPTFNNSLLESCGSAPGAAGFMSLGHNLEKQGDTCGLAAAGDQPNTNLDWTFDYLSATPAVVPYGGHATLADAADPATCPADDQRGIARPQGDGCDIGPVEIYVPRAVTGGVSNITATAATLHGDVDTDAGDSSTRFKVGTGLDIPRDWYDDTAGGIAAFTPASVRVAGLQPATTYRFRITAGNPAGGAAGDEKTFTTYRRTSCTLKAMSKKFFRKRLRLIVRCNLDVAARLTGSIRVKGRDKKFVIDRVARSARGKVKRTVKVRVPNRVVELVRDGERATAWLRLTATGRGGVARARLQLSGLQPPERPQG